MFHHVHTRSEEKLEIDSKVATGKKQAAVRETLVTGEKSTGRAGYQGD